MNQTLDLLPPIDDRFNPVRTLDDRSDDFSSDERLMVTFSTKPVMHPAKSTDAGRPIFDEVDFITIRTPGSQLTVIVAPVKEYLPRFAKQYERWKTDNKDVMSGTPIELFPEMFGKIGLQAELKALNINTVEQLANLPDNYKSQIMGGVELCKRAATWLNETNGTDAQVAQLQADNDNMREQLKALSTKMEMLDMVAKTEKPAKADSAK
jgi:hypothetical protein